MTLRRSSCKNTGYLLDETHPDRASKAVFFRGYGFRRDRWHELAEALKQHALDHGSGVQVPFPFGVWYVVEGTMITPDNRFPWVRSIWFEPPESTILRLVSAYPMPPKTSR
jgi:hypothetical protein